MDINTAEQIAALGSGPNRRLIEAISMLRRNTSFGLREAKDYIEAHGRDGEERLLEFLLRDFVQDKSVLLDRVQNEIKRLQIYAEQLEAEVSEQERDRR